MHARTVIRGLGCAGCGLGLVTQPNKTPFPGLGIWHLNKSWQRSEVSANRAQCLSREEHPGQNNLFFPGKGRERGVGSEKSTPKG